MGIASNTDQTGDGEIRYDSKEQNYRYPVHCGQRPSCGRRNYRHEALARENLQVTSTNR